MKNIREELTDNVAKSSELPEFNEIRTSGLTKPIHSVIFVNLTYLSMSNTNIHSIEGLHRTYIPKL